MPLDPDRLPLPPLRRAPDGRPRRIGVELELTGLGIERLSALVAEELDGTVERISPYEHRVKGDPWGDWGVELDFTYLKQRGRVARDPNIPMDALEEAAENILRFGAEQIMPFEVVSPPIPMEELSRAQSLVERLREAGARGTTEGLVYAFGMQLNPEVPATDADTLRRYLQAFLCLYDWLEAHAEVDLTRRLTAFVAPFPREYLRRVVDPAYRPDLSGLIDDYLSYNPTRNRALDLLPLFLELDPERVRAVVDDLRVQARPAFHYRLPNCEIDRPGWGIHFAWEEWLQIEHLVADPERLQRLCARYAGILDRPLGAFIENWREQVRAWLVPTRDL